MNRCIKWVVSILAGFSYVALVAAIAISWPPLSGRFESLLQNFGVFDDLVTVVIAMGVLMVIFYDALSFLFFRVGIEKVNRELSVHLYVGDADDNRRQSVTSKTGPDGPASRREKYAAYLAFLVLNAVFIWYQAREIAFRAQDPVVVSFP